MVIYFKYIFYYGCDIFSIDGFRSFFWFFYFNSIQYVNVNISFIVLGNFGMFFISWNRKEFSFICIEGSLNFYWYLSVQFYVESEVMFFLDCACI